jgi:hypothetical protein
MVPVLFSSRSKTERPFQQPNRQFVPEIDRSSELDSCITLTAMYQRI